MKKCGWMITGLVIAILIYLTMTPMGALRLVLLRAGHPVTAVTLELTDPPRKMVLEKNQIGYSLENPPFEWDTQAELINWVVTKHGPFYIGDYYGWG